MKSLRAFWHWVDNEKPAEIPSRCLEQLSRVESMALKTACELVSDRVDHDNDDFCQLCDHWPAMRELSFAICAGIEAMHEAVPEPEPSAAPPGGNELPTPLFVKAGETVQIGYDPTERVWKRLVPPALMIDDGLKCLRPEPGEASFRREYQGEWLTEQQRAMNSQQHSLGMQRAALTGAITAGQAFEQRAHDAINAADTVKRNAEMQLAAQRPDPRPPHHRGKTSSVYDEATGALDIYPATCVKALENIRGYLPRTITVHGKPSDYVPDALAYLPDVVQPMLVAAGAGGMLCTPDDTLEAFGL